MTKTRLIWLERLNSANGEEVRWEHMPKRANGLGAVTNATWRPLVAEGLIEGRYGKRDWREPSDWLFKITDAGRAAIKRATGG